MLGHGATGQFAIGEVAAGAAAETITPDKWFMALSEPVRYLPGVKPAAQQFQIQGNIFPVVSFGWYAELTKPPRQSAPRLNPAQVPFFSFQPAPSPFVATGWYMPLAEPVRFKPGLRPPWQLAYAADTTVIPTSKLTQWFQALSEPVRFKRGLAAARQAFFYAPSRLIPTPSTIGQLHAIEQKDIMLAGGAEFNAPASAEVGLVVDPFAMGGEVGIVGPPPVRARIAIQII